MRGEVEVVPDGVVDVVAVSEVMVVCIVPVLDVVLDVGAPTCLNVLDHRDHRLPKGGV